MSKHEGERVALFLIATKGRTTTFRVIENFLNLSGCDFYVISYGDIDVKIFINRISEKLGKRIQYVEASSNSVCSKRNLALLISIVNKYDYCILADDDIILENASAIGTLIKILETLPEECSVLCPALQVNSRNMVYGGLLYRNGTFLSICSEPASAIWFSLCPSAAFIVVRVNSIRSFFEVGLKPFEELFVIQSEDVDFAVKNWLLGYKIACTKLIKVQHVGFRQNIPHWRIYYMYRNRLLLLLLNFSPRSVIYALPFRVLHDIFHCVVLSRTRHFTSLVKAYSWILKNLKTIMTIRNYRRRYFKCNEKMLFTQLPFPIHRFRK